MSNVRYIPHVQYSRCHTFNRGSPATIFEQVRTAYTSRFIFSFIYVRWRTDGVLSCIPILQHYASIMIIGRAPWRISRETVEWSAAARDDVPIVISCFDGIPKRLRSLLARMYILPRRDNFNQLQDLLLRLLRPLIAT